MPTPIYPGLPGYTVSNSSVTIAGTTFHDPQVSSELPSYISIPDVNVSSMASWLVKNQPNALFDATNANAWLGGDHSNNQKITVAFEYANLAGYTAQGPSTSDKIGGILNAGPQITTNIVKGTVNTVMSIPDFLAKLSDGHTWIRVSEVVIGILLIAIGLEKLTTINIPGPVGSIIHSGSSAAQSVKGVIR